MKRQEVTSSLAWMVAGFLFLRGSIELGLGSGGEPGPGFFPFLMAVFLVAFSAIHFISSLTKFRQIKSGDRFWPKRDGIKRILFTAASLCGFVLALNTLGFVLTTFIFMFITLRFVEPQRWRTVLFVGSLTTVLSYSVFQIWLRSNLPEGFLGF